MPTKQQQGSKGCRKMGRNKVKCQRYEVLHTRDKHKLKHVLQSSGATAATRYALDHSLSKYLMTLVDERAIRSARQFARAAAKM